MLFWMHIFVLLSAFFLSPLARQQKYVSSLQEPSAHLASLQPLKVLSPRAAMPANWPAAQALAR